MGDDSERNRLLALQELPKEAGSGTAISPFLYKNVDDIAVLNDRSPKVVKLAAGLYEDLVQVPDVTLLSTPPLELSGILVPKLHAPPTNRLVADLDASFS